MSLPGIRYGVFDRSSKCKNQINAGGGVFAAGRQSRLGAVP